MLNHLGRYEILGLIATGGMGKVYLARVVGEGGFEREVALKVMHEHLLHEAEFVAMFLDEARLAARIRHPNVVPTIDVQKTADALFLVMDLVEGLSTSAILKQLRKRTRKLASSELTWDTDKGMVEDGKGQKRAVPIPLDIASRIIIDTLGGLQAAHELTDRQGHPLQLVHRDVSPGNILVGKDGVARITDFGVARAESRLTATMGGQIKGKLPYMPPEQIAADQVDLRADIYSAGCVLWELLVGRRLFHAEHQGALIRAVLGGQTQPPSAVNSAIPLAVDEVCARALAPNPHDRFQSAAHFAEALEKAVRGSGQNVASSRQVSAFVREFRSNLSQMADARKSAPGASGLLTDPMGSLTPSSLSQSFQQLPSTSGVGAPDFAAHPVTAATVPPGPDSVSSVSSVMSDAASLPSAGSTKTAAVMSNSQLTIAAPRRTHTVAIAGLAAGALLGAIVAVVVLASSGTESTAPAGAAEPPVVSTATATPQGDEGSQPPADTTASSQASAEPSALPSAESEAEPSAKAKTRSPQSEAPRRSTRRAPAASKPKPTEDELPSEFLPKGL